MNPKPVALPRPRRAELAAAAALEDTPAPGAQLTAMLRRRNGLAYEIGLVEAEIERMAIESICGLKDDSQDVERYDGTLGVTREFVQRYERPVGQLQWREDLHLRFSGPDESPGDVAGTRWGSGGLITDDLFITAGHCFDQHGGGWQRPTRNGVTILPAEIATLMRVFFNYQVDGGTGELRPGEAFPVEELLEYRLGGLDVAVARLGRSGSGRTPGEVNGVLRMATQDLTAAGAMLCLIQHPSGRPKRVEAGPMLSNLAGQIAYDSLDTEGGSSGSPILSTAGEIVGVHTNGGCTTFSGFNFGVAIGAIRAVSPTVGAISGDGEVPGAGGGRAIVGAQLSACLEGESHTEAESVPSGLVTAPFDLMEVTAAADVFLQAGHFRTTDGKTGASGPLGKEIDWTPVVVNEATRVLRQAGISVIKEDASIKNTGKLYRARTAVFIHFDGSTPPFSAGASVGYDDPSDKPAADAWKGLYSKYWPFKWMPDNYTKNLSGYYGYRHTSTTDAEVLFELGDLTVLEQAKWLKPRLVWLGRLVAHFLAVRIGSDAVPDPGPFAG